MAGDPQFGPAPDLGAASAAPLPPEQRDPVALRHATAGALAAGRTPGDVYATLVRPSLAPYGAAGGGPVLDTRRALARSAAHAALAELAASLTGSDDGAGRAAAVLVPPGAVGELDAQLLADVLDAAGWRAAAIALGDGPDAVVEAVEAHQAEVVLVPAGDAAQILAAQLTCSRLRRTAVPPLVVGVAFDGGPEGGTLAADAFAGDADALPALLRRRFSGGGGVRWGVRLAREDGRLVVAPAGVLDVKTAGRLRDVVETRRPLYARILIDLRELLEADRPGLQALVAWDAELPWDPSVAALADRRALDALRDAGLEGALPLA